jgi:mono/diheme cytochrome c family protein
MNLRKQTIAAICLVFAGVAFAVGISTFIVRTFPERDTVAIASENAPLIDFAVLEQGANLAELERGRVYYVQLCASCHGARGNGYGEWAYRVKPRPSDLTSAKVQLRSDEYLFKIISDGQVSSPMIGWKDRLSERQRWQVVGYLRHLALQQVHAMGVKS